MATRTDDLTAKERMDALDRQLAELRQLRQRTDAPADPEVDLARARAMVAADDALRASVNRVVDAAFTTATHDDGRQSNETHVDALEKAAEYKTTNAWRGAEWLKANPFKK
jgi:hypothetical protein